MFFAIAIIVVIVVALIVALLVFTVTRPDTFRVQRATSIKAPPVKVFPLINDFHAWVSWSPWENIDPALKRSYSGTASGARAVYEWEGNNKEIIFSKNQRLNDFIFASEFLRDAKDMRMLEETGKISNDRNMDELLDKDAPTLVPPPDEES